MEDEAKIDDQESSDLDGSDTVATAPDESTDEKATAAPEDKGLEEPEDECAAETTPERKGFWGWLKSLCPCCQSTSSASS